MQRRFFLPLQFKPARGRLLVGCSVFVLILLLAESPLVFGQSPQPTPRASSGEKRAAKKANDDDDSFFDSRNPLGEIAARREIKLAEKEYNDNVERARQAAKLANELLESYNKNKKFSRDEAKKLEKLEKLTKRIRSEAGGSEGEVDTEITSGKVDSLIGKLAEISETVKSLVEKTPRQVVNTVVIERANDLLRVIRTVRSFFN